MKHALLTLLALMCLTAVSASPFQSGKKYKIMNAPRAQGAIGLGAYHGDPTVNQVYYVKTNADITDDCWWYIDNIGDNMVAFRNAKTGQYIAYKNKFETKLEGSLTSDSEWHVAETPTNQFYFYRKFDLDYNLRVGPFKNSEQYQVGVAGGFLTYYSHFRIFDESGKELSTADLDKFTDTGNNAEKEPAINTNLASYVKDVKLNGREIAYMTSPAMQWITTIPKEANLTLTATAVKSDCTLEIYDGSTKITKSADLKLKKIYSLAVMKDGNQVTKANIIFTTMPVMDIRHGGKMYEGMQDYIWGHLHLTSADTPETVVLSAKYKTRGATASKWSKYSFNMKLRNFDTGAEEDSTLLGIRSASSWIMDAMAIDRIKMRNRVCFDLWNQFSRLPYATDFDGRNGTEGRFVETIINGKYRGIYCLTDRINRKLLDLKKPSTDASGRLQEIRGVMYKSGWWDYTGLTAVQRKEWEAAIGGDTRNSRMWCNWELVEPEDYPCAEAWQPMVDLYNYAAYISDVKKHFYIENMADFHLFVLALGLIDNGNKNEFLSARNIQKGSETVASEYDKSRFVFTPWDLDTSLGGAYDGTLYGGNYDQTPIRDYRINNNYPFSGMLTYDTDYKNYLRNRWQSARDGVLSPANVSAQLWKYALQFTSTGAYEREKQAVNQNMMDDLSAEITQIFNWYADHVLKLDDFLGLNHSNGISTVGADKGINDGTVYDLQGRKIGTEIPSEKGIYIKNGKKYLK
ncbi:MAG: CotH kinase family protein [Bacteroidaceae bacterium]|nr:CotH kinase family protein [Bacteroidaceae bacterium]